MISDLRGSPVSPVSLHDHLQNGPRRQGSASPRKTGAPLTTPGRSENSSQRSVARFDGLFRSSERPIHIAGIRSTGSYVGFR
jgi:hypothetical protein